MLQDVRLAFRLLWRAPLPASVALLSIALSIGAAAVVFAAVKAVLLEPLPFARAQELVQLRSEYPHAQQQSHGDWVVANDLREVPHAHAAGHRRLSQRAIRFGRRSHRNSRGPLRRAGGCAAVYGAGSLSDAPPDFPPRRTSGRAFGCHAAELRAVDAAFPFRSWNRGAELAARYRCDSRAIHLLCSFHKAQHRSGRSRGAPPDGFRLSATIARRKPSTAPLRRNRLTETRALR
jgi:hypothetical protein